MLLEHFFVQFRSFQSAIFAHKLLVHGILFFLEIGIMGFFWMLFKNFEGKKIFETMPAHLTCVHSTQMAKNANCCYTFKHVLK